MIPWIKCMLFGHDFDWDKRLPFDGFGDLTTGTPNYYKTYCKRCKKFKRAM